MLYSDTQRHSTAIAPTIRDGYIRQDSAAAKLVCINWFSPDPISSSLGSRQHGCHTPSTSSSSHNVPRNGESTSARPTLTCQAIPPPERHERDRGNMSLSELITAFLQERMLLSPDGRPLYAYRCGDTEFADFGEALTTELGLAPRYHDPAPSVTQAFCLWGAEWWRRNHEGGPWAWEEM